MTTHFIGTWHGCIDEARRMATPHLGRVEVYPVGPGQWVLARPGDDVPPGEPVAVIYPREGDPT